MVSRISLLEERVPFANKCLLGDLSNGIRSKALPTLSNTIHNVLNVVAPPIHDHEVLQVTVFHDLAGFAHLDRIVYESFEKVSCVFTFTLWT